MPEASAVVVATVVLPLVTVTVTADASGTYSISNMALGSYTITVAGSDASNMHYVGSLALTLTGNALNTTIKAFPG